MSTFSRKASTWWPQHKMVPHVSATFRPMTLKNKFKVFAVPRFNKITLPSQIASCEFLLIKHQRLIVLNEYLPPPPPSSEPASFLASWYWFSCKTALLLFRYIQYCSINWVKNQLTVIFILCYKTLIFMVRRRRTAASRYAFRTGALKYSRHQEVLIRHAYHIICFLLLN